MTAGGIASFTALITNYFIGRAIPRGAWRRGLSVLGSPMLEETVKTLSAAYLGAPLILAHLVFGLTEGTYESLKTRTVAPCILAALSHLAFGWLTWQADLVGAVLWQAVLVAVAAHALWNHIVLRLSCDPEVKG